MGREPHSATNSSVAEFLGRKGAIGLLCEIHPEGSQYTELANELEISRTTVSNRLQEGEAEGLFERERIEGRGTTHAYVFTEAGAELRLRLDHAGITEKHRTIKRLQRKFHDQVADLVKWVGENEVELRSPSEDANSRELLRRYGRFVNLQR
ncbi:MULTISPECIES: winged helix-turn-helix transcriptional regulator [Natronococcus]|uniref:winged helix-turn-helix transcriptional regulator n=1 Tax=Natronococcus TaxID=29287 RepID=UPI00241C8BFB|nr:winged helix-turn-helix transcriptional regulator [Natronococcus sp. A-GB7]MDG5821815.1 winged helix-turn-helix transcriptional regulator [Natronococcus sp. A-GB7]